MHVCSNLHACVRAGVCRNCSVQFVGANEASFLWSARPVKCYSPLRPSVAPLIKACLASLPGRPNVFPSSLGPQEHE